MIEAISAGRTIDGRVSTEKRQTCWQDLGMECAVAVVVVTMWAQRLLLGVSFQSGDRPSTLPFALRQSRLHPLAYERTLKLGNSSNHLEHQFTSWERRVHSLRHGNEVDPQRTAQFQPEICAFKLLAKRSNFQITTTSTDPRRQSLNISFRAGRFAGARRSVVAPRLERRASRVCVFELRRESRGAEYSESAALNSSLGDQDKTSEWLESANSERNPMLAFLRVNPLFDPLTLRPMLP
jgi:hypothetical protein